jgi:hypothetical protein
MQDREVLGSGEGVDFLRLLGYDFMRLLRYEIMRPYTRTDVIPSHLKNKRRQVYTSVKHEVSSRTTSNPSAYSVWAWLPR